MKNKSSQIKNNYSESPKTPGGISKSLLTPCRRVGLSRNWRKGSVSPFVSPLSSSNNTNTQNELRKRKKCDEPGQHFDDNDESGIPCDTPTSTLHRTPSRSLTARKKSKILVLTSQDIDNDVQGQLEFDTNNSNHNYNSTDNTSSSKQTSELDSEQSRSKVLKVSRLKLKKSISKGDTSNKELEIDHCVKNECDKIDPNHINPHNVENTSCNNIKDKSPNNLTKECMVVIQKNMFKNVIPSENNIEKYPTQTSIDSDADDIPLSNLSSKENVFKDKLAGISVKKLDKTTSVTDLIVKSKSKEKLSHRKSKNVSNPLSISSNSYDSDDDFIEDKRTILIKKSYSKIVKPVKAKSTGSVTNKDIDELQARINLKKNKLLAKAMTNETEELRILIKKWQTGCQNALTELFELIKKKMPDQSMAYSEILKMLKIPPDLVGYDSDNDCFVTPDDRNIILSGLSLDKI